MFPTTRRDVRHVGCLLCATRRSDAEEPRRNRQPRTRSDLRAQGPVVLLDYWSIWLGGTYARQQGPCVCQRRKAHDRPGGCRDQDDRGSRTARAYVSERRAFKGPSFGYIESHYLAPDGEHPNATGHQAIATATEAVIKNTLHLESRPAEPSDLVGKRRPSGHGALAVPRTRHIRHSTLELLFVDAKAVASASSAAVPTRSADLARLTPIQVRMLLARSWCNRRLRPTIALAISPQIVWR